LEEIFIFCNGNIRKEELQMCNEVPLSHYQLKKTLSIGIEIEND
jgi:hypothetical protein